MADEKQAVAAPEAAKPAEQPAAAAPAPEKKDGSFFESMVPQGMELPAEEADGPDPEQPVQETKPEETAEVKETKETPEQKAEPEKKEPEAAPKKEEAKPILGRFKDIKEVRQALTDVTRELAFVERENIQLAKQLGTEYVSDGTLVLTATDDTETMVSYREAEGAFTRATQRRADLKRQIADKAEKPEPEKTLTPEEAAEEFFKDPNAFIEKQVQKRLKDLKDKEKATATASADARAVAEAEALKAVEEAKAENPDYADLEPEIAKIIKDEIPQDANMTFKQILKLAIGTARGRKVPEITQKVKEQTEQEITERTKQQVESGAGAGTAKAVPAKSADDVIGDDIVAAGQKMNRFLGG